MVKFKKKKRNKKINEYTTFNYQWINKVSAIKFKWSHALFIRYCNRFDSNRNDLNCIPTKVIEKKKNKHPNYRNLRINKYYKNWFSSI